MNEKMLIRVLSIIAVLQSGLIFGAAVGIVATTLGAASAVAAVAAATIAVTSTGVGLTVVTMLLPGAGTGAGTGTGIAAKEERGSPLVMRG